MSVLSRVWVCSSRSSAATNVARWYSVSRASTRYWRPWCRYTAPGWATLKMRAASTTPIMAPSSATSSYSTFEPERSPTARAGEPRPAQYICPWRGFSWSARTSSRTASSRPSPKYVPSSGVSGSSWAAHATCGRSTDGLSGFTTAASGARDSSSAGWRAYHWSSWSSPTTSTAAGAPPVAPGPARLLAQRRQRAGEAVDDDRVEAADVDAELERARRDDTGELACGERVLELAPLLRQVPGSGTRRRGARPLRARFVPAPSGGPARRRARCPSGCG